MSPETLALTALVIAGTYLLFGLTGFGSTALALPILVHLVPLRFLVPLLSLMDVIAAIALGARSRRGVRWDELRRVFPFMGLGLVLGLTLLVGLPEAPLLGALGIFLVAYAAYALLRRGGPLRLSTRWSAPAGLASGAFASLYGNGGLLMALYMGARLTDKAELRATAATVVLVNTGLRTVLYGATGLLTQDGLLTAALLLLPSLAFGLFFGSRLHATVSPRVVLGAIHLVILVAGVSLLARLFVLY
ncbi:MAG: sulfite exporter TauE/SafE family protein [Proteobacteria bacterium]|nr:sulfite exporter TauE/SafE family protein [Pseudomonadota bacterium]